MAFVETPRTDAGNATYMSNAHNLENFSVENSFLSPSKSRDDLVSQLRNGRGLSLRTPRSRVPFTDRQNLSKAPLRGEFTPLLKSAARNNMLRRGQLSGVPQTPAFLKAGYQETNSPALPNAEITGLYGDDTGSSVSVDGEGTPVPQIASSSAQSTPLAVLPKRDAGGVLADQGNVMTLREQENIINRIEKENFGLKLKIHFLEEALRKAGPGFNEAAMKENTDLKVDRVTLQKELGRAKKTLSQAEREVDTYRRHLQEVQEDVKRKHIDEGLRKELETLRSDVAAKASEVQDLKGRLGSVEGKEEELERARNDAEDLEAEARERDRLIEERDDEIERLQARVKKDSEEMAELHQELIIERRRIQDLENGQKTSSEHIVELKESQSEAERLRQALQKLEEELEHAKTEVEDAKEDVKEAVEARQKAEEDLEELQDELSNKSINTKGLSRQLEDKANKLQVNLTTLREDHAQLEERFGEKSRELRKAQEQTSDAVQDAEVREQRLVDENELLRHEHQVCTRKCENLNTQVQQLNLELRSKIEEKDLLHSRHDALTLESRTLQKDLSKAQSNLEELERSLEDERQHALDNDRQLRAEAEAEINRLSEELDNLHRELEDKESQYAADRDHWESQRRNLLSQKEKADEQSAGLQRTISKLQEAEGTLSGREMKLKEALESEKQRFQSEEDVLGRQIQELHTDVDNKRQMLDDLRAELSNTKEELRVSQRDQLLFDEKVQALEDELEVLQAELDDEAERAIEEINAVTQEADSLQQQLNLAKEELNRGEAAHADAQVKNESNEQLVARLHHTEVQLDRIRTEKQMLQDKLATNNIELHSLRTASAETNAERDEMKNQLQQMENQADETLKLDQEKLNLRTAKLKLENEVGRLREERKGLLEKSAAIERELEDEIDRASAEEGRLNSEIDDLRHQVAASSEGRDRELLAARQKAQRLEVQISGLQSRLAQGEQDEDATAELSLFQNDLAAARAKETEFLQREATHKESIRDLKQNVARLERQLHEVEIARLAVNSPQPSVSGSARKDEIVELRRQLADAHQQIKDSRTKSREGERELQRKLTELNHQAQSVKDADDCERDHLELQLSSCRMQHDQQVAKAAAAEKNVARLRTRVQNLEKDLKAHRQTAAGDLTMADERKDLHEMLKDAKLTAESLQVEISSRETLLTASSSREKELRAHIRRIREERNLQLDKSTALSTELEHLQGRYERAVDNFTRQQKVWEEERRKLTSGVRFANTSVSSVHAGDTTAELKEMEQVMREKERRHEGELKGLANQIQWLKVMGRREESFRNCLVHGKKYLLKEVEMYRRYTKANIAVLTRMGIEQSPYPPPPLRAGATETERLQHVLDSIQDPATKRPSLKAVGLMLVSAARMKRLAGKWAAEKQGQVDAGRSVADKGKRAAEKRGQVEAGRSVADKGRKKEARWEGADRRKSFGGGIIGRGVVVRGV